MYTYFEDALTEELLRLEKCDLPDLAPEREAELSLAERHAIGVAVAAVLLGVEVEAGLERKTDLWQGLMHVIVELADDVPDKKIDDAIRFSLEDLYGEDIPIGVYGTTIDCIRASIRRILRNELEAAMSAMSAR